MFISNINQTDNYSIYRPAFGTTSKFHTIKKIQLRPSELEKVTKISENFSKVLNYFNSLNGILQRKFKSLYPGLVAGEKIKGFLFDSILNEKGKKLQITRLNTRNDSKELLTLGLFDSNNKNILRYQIDKDGNASVMENRTNYESADPESFSKWNLDTFVKEMGYLELYSKNFKEVGRKVNGTESAETMHQLLEEVDSVKNSKGIKNEAENLTKTYSELIAEFDKNCWRDAFELKEGYFKDLAFSHSKSMFFKDPETSKVYSYTPSKSVGDNRIFKLMICDEKEQPENGFLFFADGKVAKITPEAMELKFVRGRKMEYISDREIKNLNLINILSKVNADLQNFQSFIIEKRAEKAKKPRPYHKKTKIDIQKAETKPVKEKPAKVSKPKKLVKHPKTAEKIQIKNKTRKLVTRTVPPKAAEFQPQTKQIITMIPPAETALQSAAPVKKYLLSAASLSSISAKLNALFDTPIEERSPHLIHEKLPNGRIFSGRVALTTSDGAYVVVSRIKSPRYVDFMYYSVKVTKDGESYTMNIDPEMGLILESTPEGKVIIDKKQRVEHISKKEFLEQNPKAEKLAEYLNELFEYKAVGEKKVIDSKLKIRTLTAKEREKEVLKALGMAPELALDLLLKL